MGQDLHKYNFENQLYTINHNNNQHLQPPPIFISSLFNFLPHSGTQPKCSILFNTKPQSLRYQFKFVQEPICSLTATYITWKKGDPIAFRNCSISLVAN